MPTTALFVNDELATKRVTLPGETQPGSISLAGTYLLSGAKSSVALFDDGILVIGASTVDSVAYSLTRSLGNKYYLYLFGNNPVNVQINGICVPNGRCDEGVVTGTSYDNLYAFYERFAASGFVQDAADLPQVTVTYSGRVMTGLLLGMQVNMSDVNRRIAMFNMQIMALSVDNELLPNDRSDYEKVKNISAKQLVI